MKKQRVMVKLCYFKEYEFHMIVPLFSLFYVSLELSLSLIKKKVDYAQTNAFISNI